MPLVINLTSRDPALLPGGARRIEVNGRLSIGRGADNDLMLADPERQLSKNHCVIQFDGHAYTLTDTSTNGVFLNDSPERLMRDVPVALSEGCILRLGAYEMTVVAIAPDSGLSAPGRDFRPSSGSGGYAPGGSGRLDDGLFGDPFAAPPILEPGFGPAPSSIDDPFGFGPAPANASPFGATIPDDADLFGEAPAQDPWGAEPQHDHTPSEQQAFIPPKSKAGMIPDDWDLSDLGVEINPALVGSPSILDSGPLQPEIRPAAAPPQHQPSPQQRPPPDSSASGDAAIKTFLAAAGLPPGSISPADATRLMQVAGEMLQATTQGLMEILAARANTKQEFRIDRTMIGAARNNPLKVSEDAPQALQILLSAQTPGFISGRKAIEEALDDIKVHQLAVLAGMQVALTTVVSRFDPAKLEKRIEQSTMIESILPAARKARYWELFKTLYGEIAGELEDDFQKAFGAEFARAYREQIERF